MQDLLQRSASKEAESEVVSVLQKLLGVIHEDQDDSHTAPSIKRQEPVFNDRLQIKSISEQRPLRRNGFPSSPCFPDSVTIQIRIFYRSYTSSTCKLELQKY